MDTTSQETHQQLSISPILAINQQMNCLEQAGKEVYRFGFGQSPFPVPSLVVKAWRLLFISPFFSLPIEVQRQNDPH